MTICRTLGEVRAAALADAAADPPLTQDQADLVAAILWACRTLLLAPRPTVSALLPPVAEEPPTMLLTVEEAARELRVGRDRVYELIKSGALPSIKIGSSRRIRRADLAGYVGALKRSRPRLIACPAAALGQRRSATLVHGWHVASHVATPGYPRGP